MQINPLDVPGTPFEVELLNPNPSSSRKGYWISFQVSEEVHSAFMSAKEGNLRLVGYLSVLPDTDEQPAHEAVNGKPKKGKEPKGQHGQMWKWLHLAGFVNCPGVAEALDRADNTPTKSRWQVLHEMFGVESLAVIGPEEIYQKFPLEEFPQAAVMVEQALRKAAQ